MDEYYFLFYLLAYIQHLLIIFVTTTVQQTAQQIQSTVSIVYESFKLQFVPSSLAEKVGLLSRIGNLYFWVRKVPTQLAILISTGESNSNTFRAEFSGCVKQLRCQVISYLSFESGREFVYQIVCLNCRLVQQNLTSCCHLIMIQQKCLRGYLNGTKRESVKQHVTTVTFSHFAKHIFIFLLTFLLTG